MVAERIRAAVAGTRIEDEAGEPIPVTVSMGVAFYYSGEGIESLLGRADAGMYLAKSLGRNRVMIGPDGPQSAPVEDSKPKDPPPRRRFWQQSGR